ncbi:MAG: hypothetical protein OXC99_06375 [Chloroflexi bacterium]|nr:hypothetical protein [Chloroflexota bacterium]
MLPDFSEFSYGFAFTHEYVNRNPSLTSAPELPSLIKEAETGTDLKLGYAGHPKYFQFKLSAYLNRKNAIHWQDHLRSHYRVRITTHPRPNQPVGTDQHSQLKRLATTVDDVVYVAPRFHSLNDFNRFFLQGRITENSLWAPVKDLPWVFDSDVHYLTFTRSQTIPLWHSEIVKLEGSFTSDEHYERTRNRVTIDEDFFRTLHSRLQASLQENQRQLPSGRNASDSDDFASVLRDTYRLLTTQYGLQLVILREERG